MHVKYEISALNDVYIYRCLYIWSNIIADRYMSELLLGSGLA